MRKLDVYIYDTLVGTLVDDTKGPITFSYTPQWLERDDAFAISYSLPLRAEPFLSNECGAFFSGLLPDMNIRRIIAKVLGISAKNDFSMLEKIGGECAGAVTFIEDGIPFLPSITRYRSLTISELAAILRELPKRPLLVGEEGIRFSLAGAQDKIAVRVDSGEISLPLGSSPSTHILKPAQLEFSGTVFNEAFCMTLSRAVGIRTSKVSIHKADDIDFLLIERYDRRIKPGDGPDTRQIARLHQEDFCQALGIMPDRKYQNEGGPSLEQSFDLVRQASVAPAVDVLHLLDAIVFNMLIGNNDAHGKNFSLLHDWRPGVEPSIIVSPSYDLVSTAAYKELNKKMAMKIGGEYDSEKVFPRHFDTFAKSAGLSQVLVRRRVVELGERVLGKLPDVEIEHSSIPELMELIKARSERTIRRFST